MEPDYERLIKERCADLELVKGGTIEEALAQIVRPEINVVYLKIDGNWFAAHGEIGSEIMGFHKCKEKKIEKVSEEFTWTGTLPILDQFVGSKIVEIRHIGTVWNGHGFEFSFENEPSKTLILQSIYTGSEPKDFVDCMRIGVGNYLYEVLNPNET